MTRLRAPSGGSARSAGATTSAGSSFARRFRSMRATLHVAEKLHAFLEFLVIRFGRASLCALERSDVGMPDGSRGVVHRTPERGDDIARCGLGAERRQLERIVREVVETLVAPERYEL